MNTDYNREYTDYEKRVLEYKNCFSIGYIDEDISTKFALISLICFITYKAKEKCKIETETNKITHYRVIKQLGKNLLSEEDIVRLAVLCCDFSYGCKKFPTFGIANKDIPNKIKEILHNWVPF